MKFKRILLTAFLAAGFIGLTFAGPYDDWPDDAVCMWLDMKPTHAGYLGEAKKRSLTCKDGKAVAGAAPAKTTTSTKSTTSSKKTTSTSPSSVWKDNGVSDNVAKQLSRVGVNSAINYMGESYYFTINSSKINNNIDKVKQVFNDGFSHYTYVISNTNKFYLEKCFEIDGFNEEKDIHTHNNNTTAAADYSQKNTGIQDRQSGIFIHKI